MGKEPWSDLSVQIGSRPWRIVPDPLLCLSRDGAAFVGGLAGTHMAGHSPRAEVWLAPEFHSILDDWMLHDKHPELLAQSLGSSEDPDELRTSPTPLAATARRGWAPRWKALLGSRRRQRELLADWN